MLYLMKKMLHDLWNMKVQFIAVLLMSFFTVFLYTGLEGVWFGMTDYSEEWLDKSNTADAWVQGYAMDKDDIQKVKNLDNIENVQAVSSITAEMPFEEKYAQLLLMASSKNDISIPATIEGDEYQPNSKGIWLYQDFAKKHEIAVGDTVKMEYDGHSCQFEVRGLVLSPEYFSYTGSSVTISPNHSQYGYGYISLDSMQELTGSVPSYNQIKIRYQEQWDADKEVYVDIDGKATDQVRSGIEQELGNKYVGYSDRSDFRGISNFTDKFKQLRSMTVLFAVVLTLLAVLTIQTTMKRMIETQRIQIGTLKALGYQNWKIRLHYLFYGFWVSLIGGALGLFIAPLTISRALLSLQKDFYSLPEWNVRNSLISPILLAGVVLICSLTALLASRKGTKGMPAITMREEPPKTHGPILLERFTGLWNMFSYEWRWTLRVIAHNKVRTIIGIIGIIGSVALLMDSFGLYDSLKYANEKLYGTQFDYGAEISLKTTATKENKTDLYELAHGNAQWVQETSADIRTSRYRSNSVIQIYDKGYFNHFESENGNRVALPDDGAAISRKLAESLGLQENDTIQFRIAGQSDYITVRIATIITVSTPQGLFLTSAFWEGLHETFSPNVLLTANSDIVEDAGKLPYVSEAVTLDEQLEQTDEVINSVLMVILMLMIASLLLSIIILYNLGILSFTERSREYATLKVMGYREKELKSIIRHDNLLQLFVGLIIGIPAGSVFLGVHVHLASTSTFEYIAYLQPYHLVIIVLVISLLTLLTSSVVSRKAMKVNMVEALKSIE